MYSSREGCAGPIPQGVTKFDVIEGGSYDIKRMRRGTESNRTGDTRRQRNKFGYREVKRLTCNRHERKGAKKKRTGGKQARFDINVKTAKKSTNTDALHVHE